MKEKICEHGIPETKHFDHNGGELHTCADFASQQIYNSADFASHNDFLDFIAGDISVDVDGLALGFLKTETADCLRREGWHKSAISGVQAMAKFWIENQDHAPQPDGEWVRIETKADLPKKSGEYLCRYRGRHGRIIIYDFEIATKDDFATGGYKKGESVGAAYEVRLFKAWMPIPPFKLQKGAKDG
jgi:hypothetical protein